MQGTYSRFVKSARITQQQNENLTQVFLSSAFGNSNTAFAIDGFGDMKPSSVPNVLVTTDSAWGMADTAGNSNPTVTLTPFGSSGLPANHQPVESAWYIPGPTALIDVYTATPATTGTLVVDDPNHIIAACDAPGDNDWFAVTLTAGETYQFGQYAYAGGIPGAEGNGIALADAYLEIRDSAGNLLAVADGGGPNTPSGLDALMTFEAPTSGTYYVNATSYDNTGDGVGDFAGDYEIFARTATGTSYVTHYDISSPLHSIDWGGVMVNREHVSVRNPDGQEGPRPTGEPAADPADVEGNTLGFPGKNVIYLYFAGEGDLYANADSTIPGQVVVQNPYQYEVQAMLTAANEFSKVADVVFVSNYTFNASTGLYERDESIQYKPGPLGEEDGIKYATGVEGDGFDADFFYWSYPGTPGPGVSLLGSMSPPDYGDEGTAQFNSADARWSAQMLQPGGFSFVTLIHEFGHGMGLAHPHDTGGGSSIMLDGDTPSGRVEETTPFNYTLGDFDLNQGVYTMMSYMDGWQLSPYGQADTVNEGYGWLGSLMAFDIAVIQDKYGVNEDWATGDNTYVLKDVNEWGVYIDSATGQPAEHDATNQTTTRDGYYVGDSTRYSSIWDAGGDDSIVYLGSRDTTIDLRAASLRYESGGGGWMSYATGIFGGFTIANGVTIESAYSGAGNDVLTGNDFANRLLSGAGNDTVSAGAGADVIYAGDGDDLVEGGNDLDYINGGAGVDNLSGGAGNDVIVGELGNDRIYGGIGADYIGAAEGDDIVFGEDGNDTVFGDGGANYVNGGVGDDTIYSGSGNDVFDGGSGNDIVFADAGADYAVLGDGNDRIYGSFGDDVVEGGKGAEVIYGESGADVLHGQDDADYIDGGDDNDLLSGGGGADVLVGGAGADRAYGGTEADYVSGGDGDDVVYGDAGGDTLLGDTGADYLDGGDEDDSLFGGANVDSLIGGNGADLLDGGLGADFLAGQAGQDIFVFSSALGGGNVDIVADFQAGIDRMFLSQGVFTGLPAGALSASAFHVGSGAADADDRIIYNSSTGAVSFDADGNGAGAAVQFATLQAGLNLTSADFIIG